MMPGMAPPPPGAYIPGPFMQPMPYPNMHPPGGEYWPSYFLLLLSSPFSYVRIATDGPDATYVHRFVSEF
jgi:hypothetical protein